MKKRRVRKPRTSVDAKIVGECMPESPSPEVAEPGTGGKMKRPGRIAPKLDGSELVGMSMFVYLPVSALRIVAEEGAKSRKAWKARRKLPAGESAHEAIAAWKVLTHALKVDFSNLSGKVVCKVGAMMPLNINQQMGFDEAGGICRKNETLDEAAARIGACLPELRNVLKRSGWTPAKASKERLERERSG
ncbi:MAG: hypothetical protein K8T20_00640 [Planctomycetes bacterium]|nr:hypothetical protein [Planctomycetota bacterium]